MTFVDRVGAALVHPRRALAAADAGRGGMPDALLLVVLKLVCTETQALVVGLWVAVKLGANAAIAGLLARLVSVVGTDLLLLAGAGLATTLLAGRRRDVTRDFDLAAVAWIPVLFVDTAATLGARIAGVEIGGALRSLLQVVALAWLLVGVALATSVARRRSSS